MPIKNYTTSIDAEKTVHEVGRLLRGAGAAAMHVEYGGRDGGAVAVSFAVDVGGRRCYYRLPARAPGVLACLQEQGVARRLQTEEQAERVAWRIVKDWVDAQLALIEAGCASVEEVFLPYMLVDGDRTVFQAFADGHLLTAGDDVIDGEIVGGG